MKIETTLLTDTQVVNLCQDLIATTMTDVCHGVGNNSVVYPIAGKYCESGVDSWLFVVLSYDKFMFHIPRTGGSYFWSTYEVFKDVTEDHITFNECHDKSRDLKVLSSCQDKWLNALRTKFPSRDESFNPNSLSVDKDMTVSLVRNPFDWIVSMFLYDGYQPIILKKIGDKKCQKKNFANFIKNLKLAPRSFEYIYPFHEGMSAILFDSTGDLKVKNFLYYEKINDNNFEKYCKKLSIEKRDKNNVGIELLSKFNSDIGISPGYKSFKSNCNRKFKDYREYYDEDTKKIVEEMFSLDLKLFGYNFDGIIDKNAQSGITIENFQRN